MKEEILIKRFNSLCNEMEDLEQAIITSSKKANEIQSEIESIYLREDSTFDEVVSKMHEEDFDLRTSIQIALEHSKILIGRILECYKMMKSLGIEPQFNSPEEKHKFLNLQKETDIEITINGGIVSFEDTEFTKQVLLSREAHLNKIRSNFEQDKSFLKFNKGAN